MKGCIKIILLGSFYSVSKNVVEPCCNEMLALWKCEEEVGVLMRTWVKPLTVHIHNKTETANAGIIALTL